MKKTNVLVEENEFSMPLDLSDIISACQEFNKLGDNLQTQIDCIADMGVDEAIESQIVNKESLTVIKNFFVMIKSNPYFGDASSQATDIIDSIDNYNYKSNFKNLN